MSWSRFDRVRASVLLEKKLTLPNRLTPKFTGVGCRGVGELELFQEQKERILCFVTLFRKRIERVGELVIKLGQFFDIFRGDHLAVQVAKAGRFIADVEHVVVRRAARGVFRAQTENLRRD